MAATRAKAKAAKPKPKASPKVDIPPGVNLLLTTAQVSAVLNVHISKLRQMIAVGSFPRSKSVAGMDPRWSVAEVNAWVARNYGGDGGAE